MTELPHGSEAEFGMVPPNPNFGTRNYRHSRNMQLLAAGVQRMLDPIPY